MSTWILTGLSGAGKATAVAALERAGACCIDNLPVTMAGAVAQRQAGGVTVVVADARQPDGLGSELPDGVRVLFLDARDDVLTRRIGESTRPHPFEARGRGAGAISAEREALEPLRAAADVVIDTSEMTAGDLQRRVTAVVLADGPVRAPALRVTVSSFGYKHGPQVEADWVVDARMLRNPFWHEELRSLTGLDAPVRAFVLTQPEAEELLRRLRELLEWAFAQYAAHGRAYLHVAIGCTGGRHRSVVLSKALAEQLRGSGVDVDVRHRDVAKPDPRS